MDAAMGRGKHEATGGLMAHCCIGIDAVCRSLLAGVQTLAIQLGIECPADDIAFGVGA